MYNLGISHLSDATLSVLRASNETDSTLLITGSTGTGKSHLAYAVHQTSLRAPLGLWLKVNLATLSDNLIESELFGHEKGAFTGAETRRLGKLEASNGGTVFLDEIGELPLRLQAKLLDFIQYKKISPVGSNKDIHLDVRIIAATNRCLEHCVKDGTFREDLYHRLNIFHVRLPDLALQPRSTIYFAEKFLEERCIARGKPITGFSREVLQVFRNYTWSGNIRELENAIEFAVAMESNLEIQIDSLPPVLVEWARNTMGLESELKGKTQAVDFDNVTLPHIKLEPQPNAVGVLELPMTFDYYSCRKKFERTYIEQALRLCGGQINLTSRRIGLNKVSLAEKIKKYEIDWRRIRQDTLGL